MTRYALIAGLLLAGCVSSSETYTQSGKTGHAISCTPGWTGGIVGAAARIQCNDPAVEAALARS